MVLLSHGSSLRGLSVDMTGCLRKRQGADTQRWRKVRTARPSALHVELLGTVFSSVRRFALRICLSHRCRREEDGAEHPTPVSYDRPIHASLGPSALAGSGRSVLSIKQEALGNAHTEVSSAPSAGPDKYPTRLRREALQARRLNCNDSTAPLAAASSSFRSGVSCSLSSTNLSHGFEAQTSLVRLSARPPYRFPVQVSQAKNDLRHPGVHQAEVHRGRQHAD